MNAHEINTAEVYPEWNGQHAGHRGPAAAGSADRWYGRPCEPNFTYHGYKFSEAEMTAEQVAEYIEAWTNEEGRKEW